MASRDPRLAEAVAHSIKEFNPGYAFSCAMASPVQQWKLPALSWSPKDFRNCITATTDRSSSNETKHLGIRPQLLPRALAMAQGRGVKAKSGKHLDLNVQTICVHSDAPNVIETAKEIRNTLNAANIDIPPLPRQNRPTS